MSEDNIVGTVSLSGSSTLVFTVEAVEKVLEV